ncbi:MoxR family ATPase [Lentisphaerota bacterium WC36G]|nr:MoxR family ATPase [Lentisphaerae bacterium WC36]
MDSIQELYELTKNIKNEVNKVIIGQEDVIDKMLLTIFAGSHALIEGVPGIAKTLLVKTLGHVIDCENNRIQFTPDMMPSDITGINIYNMQIQKFELFKGPIFTGMLLADEINRAPAKTQSALLQCMQERLVSIDSTTHSLPDYFTVFATQNPIEHEGTYPLPEAQKDRFLLKIDMDYPTLDDEMILAQRMLSDSSPEQTLKNGEVNKITSMIELIQARKLFNKVIVKDEIIEYIIRIIRNTRNNAALLVGAGPRATQAMLLSARIYAVMQGRDFVTPDDVKAVAYAILNHRVILRPEFEIEGISNNEIIERILIQTAVPR